MGRKRERTDFTRRKEKAQKGERKLELLLPWADGESQVPWCLLPLLIPGGHIPPNTTAHGCPIGWATWEHVGVIRWWDRRWLSLLFLDGQHAWASVGRKAGGGRRLRALLGSLGGWKGTWRDRSLALHLLTFAFLTFCVVPCHHCPGILWRRDYSQSLIGWSAGRGRERERVGFHSMAGNAASGDQKKQIKPVTSVGPTTSF